MSLETCDVTGSTDRVALLPAYMQTETVKKVCFNVALKMEKERLEGSNKPTSEPAKEKPIEVDKPVSQPKKKEKKKKK